MEIVNSNINSVDSLSSFATGFETLVDRYYDYPVQFVTETFGAEPTPQQAAVLNAIAHKKKVSVRAGHGVGKSTLASWAVYWFLLTRPAPKIICTAPTFHQLYDVLWAEAAMWRQKSPLITELFDWKQRRIEAKWNPEYWWAAARTADKGESLAGRHAGHFLLIVDEASGIDDQIFEASEGMLTGENSYVLLIGNPTKNHGYFFDSQNKNKAIWDVHALSCYESPLVGETYIKDMEYKYGIDSNVFRVRVLGEFPYDDVDALIPHSWVKAAVDKEVTVREEPRIMGVDVGAGGDLSAIVIRKGSRVEKIITHGTKDTMELIGWVIRIAKAHDVWGICIDPIGIGKGAYDRLAEMNFKVFPIDIRKKSRRREFNRLRDELWWITREQFERGMISIPDDNDLVLELSSIKYKPESNGSIKVATKAEMKKELKHSPDRADALVLTYWIEDESFIGNGSDEDDEESKIKTVRRRNRITGY